MAHIKKMVMHGFKSFAKKTEIPFDHGINVIVGPNGSGKSNISDALCFVLGRRSAKSMRAVQAKNLIFMGSKYAKPANEACVDLIFNNADRAFAIDQDEINLSRIVRRNGQSIYKINGETKTLNEVIEMLAQADIDPHGFNLVLQGQIQSLVRMHPEERRKIVEDVAGIGVYESRKEKSLHELEKTDEKLKEIGTILRERTAHLKNLEEEKAQAQKYQNLQLTEKRLKASILSRKIDDKSKEISNLIKGLENHISQKDKAKAKADSLSQEIDSLSKKINEINSNIKSSTGIEQESLHNTIANLKAELEGLKVRKEGFERKQAEIHRRISELKEDIPEIENEIKALREKSPLIAKKSEELKKKKQALQEIEEERKNFLTLRTEISSLRERIKDKSYLLQRTKADSDSALSILENHSKNIQHKSEKECLEKIGITNEQISEIKKLLEQAQKKEIESEKGISVAESEIKNLEEIKNKVQKIDVCPLCQSKITQEHVNHVSKEAEEKIFQAKNKKEEFSKTLEEAIKTKSSAKSDIIKFEQQIHLFEKELTSHKQIEEKKALIRNLVENEKNIEKEILLLEQRHTSLKEKQESANSIEERYEKALFEIQEVSSRTDENVDNTLMYKEKEIEDIKGIIRRSTQDIEDLSSQLEEIEEKITHKGTLLEQKESQEKELNAKFKRLFEERDSIQKTIQEKSLDLSDIQNSIRQIEDQINYLKIGKAKFDAEKETLETDLKDYPGIELIKGTIQYFEERLSKTIYDIQHLGSINMRALEAYESIKKEYDLVYEKVQTVEKEKLDIMRIIEEIDKKKKRSFMKTFHAINELFTQNFSKLSNKGTSYLDFENKEDIFAGGVNIVVKMAKGKYFDVTSLSGGEQTLVALSLLFAIQEYKPYHFYVFDEIDAALDKRNSERLAGLLNQYMKKGQYIVVTHNDALITNSNILYGVSMHEGISKILSLKVE